MTHLTDDQIRSKQWHLEIDIPEGKSGSYHIEHVIEDANAPLQLASPRTAFLGEHQRGSISFDAPTRWHKLTYEGGTWMTDFPIEQIQIDHALAPFSGSVLVGGLGLGYATTKLCERDDIEEVTVVEVSAEVIELVAEHVAHPKLTVVHADLLEWLLSQTHPKSGQHKFDWAFYDIWQSDGEGTFHEVVVPLRGASRNVVPDAHVVCWNEDIMRAQIQSGLLSRWYSVIAEIPTGPQGEALTIDRLASPQEGNVWWNYHVPFFQAVRKHEWEERVLQEKAKRYAAIFGRPGWLLDWRREHKLSETS